MNTTEGKTRWKQLYIQGHLTFCVHDIHTNNIEKKEYKNVSQSQEIYLYHSMNKQYVERDKNGKRLLNETQ